MSKLLSLRIDDEMMALFKNVSRSAKVPVTDIVSKLLEQSLLSVDWTDGLKKYFDDYLDISTLKDIGSKNKKMMFANFFKLNYYRRIFLIARFDIKMTGNVDMDKINPIIDMAEEEAKLHKKAGAKHIDNDLKELRKFRNKKTIMAFANARFMIGER